MKLKLAVLFLSMLYVLFSANSPASGILENSSGLSYAKLYLKAVSAYEHDHFQKVIDLLDPAPDIPDHDLYGKILFILGKAHSRLGNTDKAVNLFASAARLQMPVQDVILFEIGYAYTLSREYEKARQTYNSLIIGYPDSPFTANALLEIADIYAAQGDYQEARKNYISLLYSNVSQKQKELILFKLARLQEYEHNYRDAYRSFLSLVTRYPSTTYKDQVRERLSHLEKVLQEPPFPEPGDILAGARLLQEEGCYNQSIDLLKQFISYYPTSPQVPEAYYLISANRYHSNQYNNTLLTLKEYFSRYPDHQRMDDALYYKAKALQKLGMHSSALATYQQITQNFPHSDSASKALYNLGMHYYRTGNNSLKEKYFTDLYTRYPDSTLADDAIWALGYNYYQKKNYKKALDILQKAKTLHHKDDYTSDCIYWAAKSAEKLGDTDTAFTLYSYIYDNFPNTFHAYRVWQKYAQRHSHRKVLVASRGHTPFTLDKDKTGLANTSRMEFLIEFAYDDEAHRESLAAINSPQNSSTWLNYKIIMSDKKYKVGNYYDGIKEIEGEVKRRYRVSLDIPRAALELSYPRIYWNEITQYAHTHKVDPYLVAAIIREESRYNPKARSRTNAQGLMQIMPKTGEEIAQRLRMRNYYTKQLQIPEINIKMGTYYISRLMDNFSNNIILALAGYNGGPRNTYKWWKYKTTEDIDEFIESIPYSETRNYIKKVLRSYWMYQKIYS